MSDSSDVIKAASCRRCMGTGREPDSHTIGASFLRQSYVATSPPSALFLCSMMKEAVSGWDVGEPAPECRYCDGGVLDLEQVLSPIATPEPQQSSIAIGPVPPEWKAEPQQQEPPVAWSLETKDEDFGWVSMQLFHKRDEADEEMADLLKHYEEINEEIRVRVSPLIYRHPPSVEQGRRIEDLPLNEENYVAIGRLLSNWGMIAYPVNQQPTKAPSNANNSIHDTVAPQEEK